MMLQGVRIFSLLLLGNFVVNLAVADAVILSSVKTHGCTVSLEAYPEWSSVSVRIPVDCGISPFGLERLLADGMSRAYRQQEVSYKSVFLGRLIDYPWMVKKLVAAAANFPEWDAKRGRAAAGHENALIGRLLFRKGVLEREIRVIEQAGYKVTGVSVEKVLIGTAERVPEYISPEFKGRLPFDAQIWIVIRNGHSD